MIRTHDARPCPGGPTLIPPVPDADRLPAEVVEHSLFVNWRFGEQRRDGRYGKVPCDRSGRNCDATNPRSWLPFDAAHAAAVAGRLGVGVVLDPAADLVAVDLDGCRDDGTGRLTPLADAVVYHRLIGSYLEASPSGTGLRVLARGRLDPLGKTQEKVPGLGIDGGPGGIEMYPRRRPCFNTLTGLSLGTPVATLADLTDALHDLQRSLGPSRPTAPPGTTPAAGVGFDGDPDTLLRRAFAAKHGDRTRRLWHGSYAGYSSFSEAVLVLANALAPWVGPDAGRLHALLSDAPLVRDDPRACKKWRSRRPGGTWGLMHVAVPAVAGCTGFIGGRRPPAPNGYSPSSGCTGLTPRAGAAVGGLSAAMAAVRAGRPAPGFGLAGPRDKLAALCFHLSRFHPDGWFFLACTDAGRLLGVSHVAASKHLLALAAGPRPAIARDSKGSRVSRQASEYRWLGPAGDPVPSALTQQGIPP